MVARIEATISPLRRNTPGSGIFAINKATNVSPTPMTLTSKSRLACSSASWSIVSLMALSIASSWVVK
jgi:hypothetical protein